MSTSHAIQNFNWVWDINTLDWVKEQQAIISTDALNVTVSGTVPVTGPLTDAQLRASPVVVTGAVLTI